MRKTLELAAAVGLDGPRHARRAWPGRRWRRPASPRPGVSAPNREGPLEGVVVTAQKDRASRSPFTVVLRRMDGPLAAFPNAKLEPGGYALKVRAIGLLPAADCGWLFWPGVTARRPRTASDEQSRRATHLTPSELTSGPAPIQ